MLKFLLGAAAAFALLSAAPASACPDCKDCPHKHEASAQAQKAGAVAEADKKDGKSCACAKSADTKACQCGEKCACDACPLHGKKAEKTEKKT